MESCILLIAKLVLLRGMSLDTGSCGRGWKLWRGCVLLTAELFAQRYESRYELLCLRYEGRERLCSPEFWKV